MVSCRLKISIYILRELDFVLVCRILHSTSPQSNSSVIKVFLSKMLWTANCLVYNVNGTICTQKPFPVENDVGMQYQQFMIQIELEVFPFAQTIM